MKIPKKCEYVRFKNYERKMKSPFMIMKILLENVRSKISMSLIRIMVKNMLLVVSVINQQALLIKSFKSYLGGDIAYNFVNSMIG